MAEAGSVNLKTLDRRVSDQKAAKELANIIRQLWVDSAISTSQEAVIRDDR